MRGEESHVWAIAAIATFFSTGDSSLMLRMTVKTEFVCKQEISIEKASEKSNKKYVQKQMPINKTTYKASAKI